MTPDEEALLIEQVASAWRPAGDDELHYHKAWHDLPPEGRLKAYELARGLRRIEAAIDPGGLSTTARAVLAKIRPRNP